MLEEVSGTGMRPLLRIFLHMCNFVNFCEKMQKNENRLYPLRYEEVLEDIIKTA